MTGDRTVAFRMGEARDAQDIAFYFNMQNNGLSEVWWTQRAPPGESWQEAFAHDILLPNSVAHFASCVVAELEGRVVGLLMVFPQMPLLAPDQLGDIPSSERNLIELRRLKEGSLFLAVVAVHPDHRGLGIGHHFVTIAMDVARSADYPDMFVIVHQSNTHWLQSFLRRGFVEGARADVGDHKNYPPGSQWILLTRLLQHDQQEDAA